MRFAWLIALAACTSEAPLPDEAPAPPPDKADSPYRVTGAKHWYLVGDALTPGDDHVAFSVEGPAQVVDAWLDGHYLARGFDVSIDLANVSIGAHTVLLAADGAHTAFAKIDFEKSYPLYVDVTNDWDTADHGDDKLARQDRLHANHPHLVLTHFVGPYTFTDTTVAPARVDQLLAWLHQYAQDEIGLHIHPYCNFVTAAGVTCRTQPSFAKASDATGYTVILASYTEAELAKMFAKANELFVAHGLAAPTSFRAGGWTAQAHVLRAMAANGYVADTSAVNWARLEEWEYEPGAQLYQWNMQNWLPIGDTTQPYYPSTGDILADADPHGTVLEVPDNGALVDYVTGQEMIDIFHRNFDGHALAKSTLVSIGYHPVDFSEEFFQRIDQALTEIDAHLYAEDKGPVIYARVSDLPKAFPR